MPAGHACGIFPSYFTLPRLPLHCLADRLTVVFPLTPRPIKAKAETPRQLSISLAASWLKHRSREEIVEQEAHIEQCRHLAERLE